MPPRGLSDTEASESQEPPGPKRIQRLQESLINRIAAGEIIHRPSSALKELLENSLDAGSTSIRVTIKDGGLKLLRIQDNGCGIQKTDLPILAERFTTSKLSTYSDLSHLTTYGFRGEALASISHVAHLSVITKTKKDSCAWKACYLDGALTPSKPGLTVDPKPCAGNDGTVITVENLFYNMPNRLSALRSSSEEYARILDVITRYAIHNPHVSFVCKKSASPSPDLTTPSNSSVDQAIRLLYGQTVFKHLMKTVISSEAFNNETIQSGEGIDTTSAHETDQKLKDGEWKAEAFFTNINHQSKKTIFLLFINHRLVESSRIKKAIESIYINLLPKGAFPFVYLSIDIDPQAVDVNVHPTKREVHFLNEDLITEQISDELQRKLAEQSASRVFTYHTQTLLPGAAEPSAAQAVQQNKVKELTRSTEDEYVDASSSLSNTGAAKEAKKTYSKNKIRTSQNDRTLDSMFPVASDQKLDNSTDYVKSTQNTTAKQREIKESDCYLTSVINLRKAVEKNKHNLMTEILEKHIFVGVVDLQRSLSLVQHSMKLYLVNHNTLAEELFYQLGLRQFGNLRRLKLQPPPPIRNLIKLAVVSEESLKTSGISLTEEQVIDRIVNKLVKRADMLNEYFSIHINSQGKLESIPLLTKDFMPDLDKLPLFLMRLGPQVDWTSEQECFSSFLRELAYFYSFSPLASHSTVTAEREKSANWQIEHSLFPTLRKYLVAPKSILDRDIVQVASLPDLYRVFERC